MGGTIWYKRFKKECEKMSSHIQFREIKYGFVRIYLVGGGNPAYLHEVYKYMPYKGYDIEEKDPRFQNKRYFEEYEDQAELTLKIKNFVEGYWDSIKTIRKRIYMFNNNKEFHENACNAYRQIRIK